MLGAFFGLEAPVGSVVHTSRNQQRITILSRLIRGASHPDFSEASRFPLLGSEFGHLQDASCMYLPLDHTFGYHNGLDNLSFSSIVRVCPDGRPFTAMARFIPDYLCRLKPDFDITPKSFRIRHSLNVLSKVRSDLKQGRDVSQVLTRLDPSCACPC